MMRYPASSPRTVIYQFGPGPITLVVKLLIWANVALFVLSRAWLLPELVFYLGLQPEAVLRRLYVWQPVTYMFVHAGTLHILFNMLALWMFGVELERRWGPRFFLKYYLVTGIGAAATTLALAFWPWGVGTALWHAITVGASGAIYGLLLAYALYFPDRPIYVMVLFPVRAKYAVMIFGAIELMLTLGGDLGGVANSAHLGGLVVASAG
jgi:membrane associated rhomboid family serine protease